MNRFILVSLAVAHGMSSSNADEDLALTHIVIRGADLATTPSPLPFSGTVLAYYKSTSTTTTDTSTTTTSSPTTVVTTLAPSEDKVVTTAAVPTPIQINVSCPSSACAVKKQGVRTQMAIQAFQAAYSLYSEHKERKRAKKAKKAEKGEEAKPTTCCLPTIIY